MPFTFSHPAIVLPIHKVLGERASLTGLIVGSLTPDFEYFLRMKMYGHIGHAFWGIWLFCLPVGLMLCLLFHAVIKRPVIENSPMFLQRRFSKLYHLDWLTYCRLHWFIVCVSIIVGAYSHLFWDMFTHRNTAVVHALGFNKFIGTTTIPIYKCIQLGSTAIGALVLAVWVWSLPTDKAATVVKPHYSFWLKVAILSASIVLVRVLFYPHLLAYGHLIVNTISAGMVGILLISLWEKSRLKS